MKISTVRNNIIFLFSALIFSGVFWTFVRTGALIFSPGLLAGLGFKGQAAVFLLAVIIFWFLFQAHQKKPFSPLEMLTLALPLLFGLPIFGDRVPVAIGNNYYYNWFLAALYITIASIISGLAAAHLLDARPLKARFFRYLFYAVLGWYFLTFLTVITYLALSHFFAFDSSLHFQAMFNTAHGQFLKITCRNGLYNFLGFHFSPTLALISPLCLLWPSPLAFYYLLVSLGGLAALPLRSLARQTLNNEILADLIGIAYLTFVPLSSVVMTEFREIALAVPLVITAFYFLKKNNRWLFFIFSLLAMGCKEEMLMIYVLVGGYLLIFKKERLLGAGLALTAIGLAFLYYKILLPFSTQEGYLYYRAFFGDLAHPLLILKRIFSWRSLQYFIFIFSPLLFMAWLSGGFIMTFAVTLFLTLATSYPMFASINHHYSGSLLPFVFIAGIYGLARFKFFPGWFIKFAAGYILINVLLTNLFFGQHFFKPHTHFFRDYQPRPRNLTVFEVKKLIPPEAPLIIDNLVGPWLSFRPELYVVANANLNNLERFRAAKNKVTHILLYTSRVKNHPFLNLLAREKNWGVIFYKNDLILLKKGTAPVFDEDFIRSHRFLAK